MTIKKKEKAKKIQVEQFKFSLSTKSIHAST